MSVIGQQIRKYRMAKGITQEQLGELVGVTTLFCLISMPLVLILAEKIL